mmetsp:Transcript_58786/g.137265  ORF Transcript_58786/g.137265 Transcript_58786/m.137265 type:complete len:588 (+) Transcript_58786:56-1819(+)
MWVLAAALWLLGCLPICAATAAGHWWQKEVMYQIYPRSFQDSDGDGTGDLKGIEQRLQYLKELGVGFVWLSPVMRSPMADFGYDISDFFDVDPLFGTMEDMKALIAAAKKLGIRILMDFVPNHSSNESAWFKEARSSKTNPKRDWYMWHPGVLQPDGTRAPPNNWASNFGGGLGSSWTWDSTTEEFYYHAFGEFQPDLNYRNPEVVEAMKEVLRFWLRLGVGGFRIDAVPFLLEDPQLRNEAFNASCARVLPIWNCMVHNFTQNDPRNHEIIQGWRKTVDEFEDRVIFGEIYAPLDDLMKYYGTPDAPEFNVPFNFEVLGQDYGSPNDLTSAKVVRDAIAAYAAAKPKGYQGNWVLGNHDNHRLMDRVHNDTVLAATVYAFFNLIPGTPVVYQGDEIAMRDLFIPYDLCRDPMCLKNPDKFAETGRDPERTPMQWSPGAQAGFSASPKTWLPVNPDHVTVNVATEDSNPASPLSIMKSTLAWRSANSDLALGEIRRVADNLPEELQETVVIVEYDIGAQVGATVGNWNSTVPLKLDLLSLLQPASDWQLQFSTVAARKTGMPVAEGVFSLSPGEVVVVVHTATAVWS